MDRKPTRAGTLSRVKQYIADWKTRGYSDDIPDEVPHELMKLNLAPSYKAIALALLSNDVNLESLGFSPTVSKWYGYFKRIELEQRAKNREIQCQNSKLETE